MLAAEAEEEVEEQGSVLDENKSDKLWLCQLLQFFVIQKDFRSLQRTLDNLVLSLEGMTTTSVRSVDVTSCQVIYLIYIQT